MSVFFVGPLPPPTHGFSVVNAAMKAEILAHTSVVMFDRTGSSKSRSSAMGNMFAFWSWLACLWHFFSGLLARRPASVYVALSGGYGQFLDFPFLSLARLFRVRTFVHHHSFAYLNEPRFHNRIVIGSTQRAVHIVLCSCMADDLARTYGISRDRLVVLSNVAFTGPAQHIRDDSSLRDNRVVVGFLSNITAEKGIFDFFDFVQAALAAGCNIQAVIAGPVDPSISVAFFSRLQSLPSVSHVGAVYGSAKTEFLIGLDFLMFPTHYANEAQPMTIFEALSTGVFVIANARGCIISMIPEGCGLTVDADKFISASISAVQQAAVDPAAHNERRVAIRTAYSRLHKHESFAKSRMLAELCRVS